MTKEAYFIFSMTSVKEEEYLEETNGSKEHAIVPNHFTCLYFACHFIF